MNPAKITTAGLICEELQFLPALVVLKKHLGPRNGKKTILKRERKNPTWRYAEFLRPKLFWALSLHLQHLQSCWVRMRKVNTKSCHQPHPPPAWAQHRHTGAGTWMWLKETWKFRKNWKWENKLLWDGRYVFFSSLRTLFPSYSCAFPDSLVGQKGRMQGKATALDLGEGEDSQPSSQVISALQVDYSTHH